MLLESIDVMLKLSDDILQQAWVRFSNVWQRKWVMNPETASVNNL